MKVIQNTNPTIASFKGLEVKEHRYPNDALLWDLQKEVRESLHQAYIHSPYRFVEILEFLETVGIIEITNENDPCAVGVDHG